jgi:hypothetical protein
VAGAVPDQALAGSRDELDCLGIRGVARDRPVVVTVEPNDLGQQVRIGSIRLRARGGVPFAVAGHRHRIDREDFVAGRDQCRNPRTAVGLDADLDQRLRLPEVQIGPLLRHMRRDQRMQGCDPVEPLR